VREGWRSPENHFHGRRVLLIWCIFTFVFFSVSGSKLPSYILPMFPALGMLIALAIEKVSTSAWKWHLFVPVVTFLLALCVYPLADAAASPTAPLPVWQHLMRYLAVAGVIGLAGTWSAWRALQSSQKTTGIAIIALTSLMACTIAMTGHNSYGQLKSTKGIVQTLAPFMHRDTEVFSVRMYDQTFPFYLRRPVTLVEFRDEFTLGQQVEADRWIPTLEEFERRWASAPSAAALMTKSTYDLLTQQCLPMKIAYRDGRRLVVVKP
jgi:4-amino-4-deoxy-L-arabinose transferase-like glycosyltransferase